MRLLKMFFVVVVAAATIGLSSCAKEEVSPPVVDADASEMIYANAGGEREEDPDEDCRCEFRFFSQSNIPSDDVLWSFAIMGSSGPDLEIQFDGVEYTDPDTGDDSSAYPSPFWDLPNSPGFVTFAFLDPLSELPSNATITVQIDCYSQNDNGTEALASTTYHTLTLSDATGSPGGIFRFPAILTSCLSQIGL